MASKVLKSNKLLIMIIYYKKKKRDIVIFKYFISNIYLMSSTLAENDMLYVLFLGFTEMYF